MKTNITSRFVAPKEKNLCGRTRDKSNPYEIWVNDGWTWKVLKKYQTPTAEAANKFARWFCFVTSPFCPYGEYGDTYRKDIIRSGAKKIVDNCPKQA